MHTYYCCVAQQLAEPQPSNKTERRSSSLGSTVIADILPSSEGRSEPQRSPSLAATVIAYIIEQRRAIRFASIRFRKKRATEPSRGQPSKQQRL